MTSIPRHSTGGRIEAFDSLRGLAAIGVVLWHYGAHFQTYPAYELFSPFYRAGYLLVDFFFVLSGYVIARAYWKQGREQHLMANLRARFARLYPLHFFTLFAVALMQWMLIRTGHTPFVYTENTRYNFLLNALMLNGVGIQTGFSFNGPAWSISTEFVVNCLFMIFIASAMWVRGLYALICIAILAVLFSLSHALIRDNRILGYLDPQLIRCMIGFSTGVLLQVAHRRDWLRLGFLPSRAWDVMAASLLMASVGFMATQRPHANVLAYLIFIALSAALLASVFRSSVVKMLLQLKPLVFLGDISYSIYLTHFPLQLAFILAFAWTGRTATFGNIWIMGAYFSSLIGISYLTHRHLELPCQSLLNPRKRVVGSAITASPRL